MFDPAPHDLGRKLRVGRKGDVLLLRGRIGHHFLLPPTVPVQIDSRRQDLLGPIRADTLAKMHQLAGLARRTPLQLALPTEKLRIRT